MKPIVFLACAAAMFAAPTTATAQSQDERAEAIERLRQIFGGSQGQRGTQAQEGWQIGPIVRGRNYSPGMPSMARPWGSGFDIEFPTNRRSHVHYVTRPVRSLAGARDITVRYRIDAARGARFVPQAQPDRPATVSLYFQRAGDDWSGTGRHVYYRWYAPVGSIRQLAPGDYEMKVRLDDPRWVGVSGGVTSGNSAGEFADAKANAARVGLVFGSTGLRGHGVYATAPARITVTEFNIR